MEKCGVFFKTPHQNQRDIASRSAPHRAPRGFSTTPEATSLEFRQLRSHGELMPSLTSSRNS